jgi:hypothetical protein
LVADAEHGAEDHREGDALGVRAKRERSADRPRLHVALGDLADQLAIAAHAVSVEGGQQELALAQVLVAVERQHRARAQGRLEHRRVGLTGVELRGVAGEDSLDGARVGDVDDSTEVGERDGEDVAVATVEADEEADRIARVADCLDRAGKA